MWTYCTIFLDYILKEWFPGPWERQSQTVKLSRWFFKDLHLKETDKEFTIISFLNKHLKEREVEGLETRKKPVYTLIKVRNVNKVSLLDTWICSFVFQCFLPSLLNFFHVYSYLLAWLHQLYSNNLQILISNPALFYVLQISLSNCLNLIFTLMLHKPLNMPKILILILTLKFIPANSN